MKVLHITQSLSPEWGGPSKVVSDLTEALAKKGVKISIFAPVENGKARTLIKPKGVDLKLFPTGFLSRFWTSFSPALAGACQSEISKFDLVHIHEIWHHPHFAAYREAKKARKPYVVTLHGQLDTWCLNHKALKKKIYSTLIQKRILKKASGLHAIAEEELKVISNYVDNGKVFIIPNGISLEHFQDLPPREEIEKLYPELKGKYVLLFLGRIHPKKGLDILAKAFGAVLKERSDIQLLIAGPDNDGYKNHIEKILKREGALENTTFTGMLTGSDKLAALSRSDVFVLPSYSDVLGISTLEAMACGIPVIITKNCNFPEVAEAGAGEVIEPDVAQLEKVLMKLLGNPGACNEMGKRGKRLIEDRYTWDKIASEMIEVYESVLRKV
jgi:glycosyltransferase involved in cell wall biosynthesis